MKKLFRKLDKGMVSLALWTSLLLAYIMPFKEAKSGFATGFPFRFMTVYEPDGAIISSSHINIGMLIVNVVFIYFILCLLKKVVKVILERKNSDV